MEREIHRGVMVEVRHLLRHVISNVCMRDDKVVRKDHDTGLRSVRERVNELYLCRIVTQSNRRTIHLGWSPSVVSRD